MSLADYPENIKNNNLFLLKCKSLPSLLIIYINLTRKYKAIKHVNNVFLKINSIMGNC